jgi:prolyl 4-hydroxylase
MQLRVSIMTSEFNADWKNWIRTNIDNGQDKNGIFKILLDEGYSYDAIRKEMNFTPSVPTKRLVNPFKAAAQLKQANQVHNYGSSIDPSRIFIPNANKWDDPGIELYCLDNFLNDAECDYLVTSIKSKLKPSELSSYESDESYRTSRTCELAVLNDKIVLDIDSRICKILGIHPSYSEAIQGQYYEVGQQFKAHTDYFEQSEIQTHGGVMGQRTYTCMIYLNDVEEGGETHFTRVGAELKPRTGMAVIWNSLNPDGLTNVNTMHQALPVIKGYKAVITKWFRSFSALPAKPSMFIKEANEYIPNYTQLGFVKGRLPEALFDKIATFYRANKQGQTNESVLGDFIFNEKDKSKNSSALVNLSAELRDEIHDTMKPLMEQWCEKALDPTYVYGIRIYHGEAVLKSHRDRLETHIISAIINVAQEVDEDWPLVIEDNYYRTHHVMLKPGDMMFYEGGRLIHGRPITFKGKSFANVFCHFKPVDYVPRKLRAL